MRISFGVLSLICCAVLFSATAQAACGGGGFKVSSKPGASALSASSSSQSSQSQSYSVSYSQTIPMLDMRQFDATGKRLQITTSQQADIDKLREDVAKRAEGWRIEVDRAQAKLDNCDGKCDKERRKLEEAKARMKEFENREFSPRALGILTEQQRKLLYERNEAR